MPPNSTQPTKRSRYKPNADDSIPLQPKSKPSNPTDYPIGGFELIFCFLICISHCLAGCYLAIRASAGVGQWLNSALRESPYAKGWLVDDSDVEWMLFRAAIVKSTAGFIIHSVVFRLSHRITSEFKRSLLLCIFWTLLTAWLTTWTCVRNCALLAISVTSITMSIGQRNQITAWILCVLFVCFSGSNWIVYELSDPQTYYREFQLYIYFSVKVLNFNIYLCRNGINPLNVDLLLKFVEYGFYPPYASLLIVRFEDFLEQRKQIKAPHLCSLIWMSVRVVFWFYFVELALHFIRVNAFFNAPFTMVSGLHNYEVFSVAYIRGQFFQTKYVVIFGLPRLFALVDGMRPPGPAVCISRITKYSRMWRYFDRGLYDFLKTQLYVPLVLKAPRPWLGRFAAMLVVFGFVLCWHGLNFNFFAWVALSAIELSVERIGAAFYASTSGVGLREWMGEKMFTRLTAVALLSNVIPGIFGAFFFLDHRDLGWYTFQRVLLNGFTDIITFNVKYANAGFVLSHLLLLGYCFNHVCCYLHTKLDVHHNKPKTS